MKPILIAIAAAALLFLIVGCSSLVIHIHQGPTDISGAVDIPKDAWKALAL